ncbi:hypothetical protein FB45DRAFT_1119124 [Roridomyces roridus]|uniref:F-box domain-containing protein n=1 Tax=Roridomyces roridus TaxID=1738132 RepID=A0AAD7B616_9AGAR|nr:hypothetical protein FB45DRAFT_1119124 [Roridomyces roridus]
MASSQWNHLLDSNDPPLDADIPVIRHLISEKQTRLNALNSEIRQLLSERKKIAHCIQRHTAIVAPIRRLPTELLSEIFSFASRLFTRRSILVNEAEEECAPWILGQVCRVWRELALHSPFLWRRIALRIRPGYLTERALSMFEAQVIRSGTATLDIDLRWQDNPATGMALLDLLISHSQRWAAFRMKIESGGAGILPRLRYIHGRIPQLKKFGFSDLTRKYGEDQEEHFLSQAPCLREITLTPRKFVPSEPSGSTPRFHVPWNQITHFSGTFSAKVHLAILAVARNLVDCNLVVRNPLPPPHSTFVVSPRLRRLCISGDSCVLDHITAPSLEELTLHGDDLLIQGLPPLIDRSSCRLTKLVFDGYPLDLSTDLFRSLPCLKYLMFMSSQLPDGFWDAMTLSDGFWDAMTLSDGFWDATTFEDTQSDLCPDLEAITCHWSRIHEEHINPLHAMMRSRNPSSGHGRTLSLRFFYGYHFPEGTEILEFAKDNPQFDVSFVPKKAVSMMY